MLDRFRQRWDLRRLGRALRDPAVQEGIREAAKLKADALVRASVRDRHQAKVLAKRRARSKQARASRKANR